MLAAARDRPEASSPTPSSAHDAATAANSLGPAPLMPHQGLNPLPMTSSSPNIITSPPSYSQSAASIHFPDVPSGDLVLPPPTNSPRHSENSSQGRLPPFSSLTGGEAMPIRGDMALHQARSPPLSAPAPPQWAQLHAARTLPPLGHFAQPSPMSISQRTDSTGTIDADTGSTGVISAASPDRYLDARSGSVSLDDPDVRLAAEALGDLRAGWSTIFF
jgi:hypothetical protein